MSHTTHTRTHVRNGHSWQPAYKAQPSLWEHALMV